MSEKTFQPGDIVEILNIPPHKVKIIRFEDKDFDPKDFIGMRYRVGNVDFRNYWAVTLDGFPFDIVFSESELMLYYRHEKKVR